MKDQSISLKMNNTNIQFYDHVKFLGMIFDSHLNWKAHINNIKGKALKALNILKKLAHTSWGADRKTMLLLYKSTVLPVLDYGSPIYCSASMPTLKLLNPVHHLGLRIATGAFKSSPTTSVIVDSGDLPLEYRHQITSMKKALTIKNGNSVTKKSFDRVNMSQFIKMPPFPIRANRLLEQNNLKEIDIFKDSNSIPPWMINQPKVCTSLFHLSKKTITNPDALKQHALKHMNKHLNCLSFYTDGSKTKGGVGFSVISKDFRYKSSLIQEASVYTAELYAIKTALQVIFDKNVNNAVIYTDSKSSAEAINSFNPKHELVQNIRLLFHKLKRKNVSVTICWIPSHTGIQGNEMADEAAKEAIGSANAISKLPIEDWLVSIKDKIRKNWENEWRNMPMTNKLRQIKEITKPWDSSSQRTRKNEVVLTRLRIGHTNLTHRHLMNSANRTPPVCDSCQVQVTIKHIFEDCRKYSQYRNSIFKNLKITDILAEGKYFSSNDVFRYLRYCKLFNKI